jgi:hypothetical protein
MEAQNAEVVVADIKMPFWSMITFMVKWVIASIPAFLILGRDRRNGRRTILRHVWRALIPNYALMQSVKGLSQSVVGAQTSVVHLVRCARPALR